MARGPRLDGLHEKGAEHDVSLKEIEAAVGEPIHNSLHRWATEGVIPSEKRGKVRYTTEAVKDRIVSEYSHYGVPLSKLHKRAGYGNALAFQRVIAAKGIDARVMSRKARTTISVAKDLIRLNEMASTSETAKHLRIAPEKVWRLAKAGEIPFKWSLDGREMKFDLKKLEGLDFTENRSGKHEGSLRALAEARERRGIKANVNRQERESKKAINKARREGARVKKKTKKKKVRKTAKRIDKSKTSVKSKPVKEIMKMSHDERIALIRAAAKRVYGEGGENKR